MIDMRDNGHITEAHENTLIARNAVVARLAQFVRCGKTGRFGGNHCNLNDKQTDIREPSSAENPVIILVEVLALRHWATMLDLLRDGAEHVPAGCGAEQLREIEELLAGFENDGPGVRLYGNQRLGRLLTVNGGIGRLAAQWLGEKAQPVRAVLFDKSATTNWSLGWHQDRVVVVKEKIDTIGYDNWTIKAGHIHVTPPFDILESMLTLRLHLDPVGADNAPLLIALGSHRLGQIPEHRIKTVLSSATQWACLADRGDVWVYATPILHASARSLSKAGRRVLQIDYSAVQLHGDLKWLGV